MVNNSLNFKISNFSMCPNFSEFYSTVKVLKIWTPEKVAVITLKFEQGGFTIEYCIQRMQTALQTV